MSKAAASSGQKQVREKTNWLIHMLYVRQDYDKCLTTIEEVLKECKGMAEYPIYVKALIKRQRGEIQESLQLFQAATCLNPHNICNLKQVGRSLYLLGKHKAALDVYEEAQRIGIDDWEIWHNKGLCNMYLKQYEPAADCFKRANAIQRHDATYMQLGKVFTLQEEYKTAIEARAPRAHAPMRPHAARRTSPSRARYIAAPPDAATAPSREARSTWRRSSSLPRTPSCSRRSGCSTSGWARTTRPSTFSATRSPTTRAAAARKGRPRRPEDGGPSARLGLPRLGPLLLALERYLSRWPQEHALCRSDGDASRLSSTSPQAQPEDDFSGRLDHPGPPGHGRGSSQVPRGRGADAQLGPAVEQHRHVLLRQAAVRRVDRVPPTVERAAHAT